MTGEGVRVTGAPTGYRSISGNRHYLLLVPDAEHFWAENCGRPAPQLKSMRTMADNGVPVGGVREGGGRLLGNSGGESAGRAEGPLGPVVSARCGLAPVQT